MGPCLRNFPSNKTECSIELLEAATADHFLSGRDVQIHDIFGTDFSSAANRRLANDCEYDSVSGRDIARSERLQRRRSNGSLQVSNRLATTIAGNYTLGHLLDEVASANQPAAIMFQSTMSRQNVVEFESCDRVAMVFGQSCG